ncbi:Zinc phosphodiesterase ELAC protein 2 [Gryganskiella cystojenkinii]|nr:Zinc phosphodiesterase ELAC protein 2 [Gryganskiella cystojenkinii]
MKAYLQILSTGTADCPPSIVLHFDSQRYMINCGEGIQRLCLESKFRYGKLKTILLTRNHWDCFGGLPGMMLTVSDVGIRHLKLLGPKNMIHSLLSTRHFMHRHRMAVEALEFDDQVKVDDDPAQQFVDDNLRITAVVVHPDQNAEKTPGGGAAATLDPEEETENDAYRKDALSAMFNLNQYKFALERLRAQQPKGAKNGNQKPKETRAEQDQNSAEKQPKPQEQVHVEDDEDMTDSANKGPNAEVELDELEMAASVINNASRVKMDLVRQTDLPRTQPNSVAISYICQTRDYPGKFDKNAALDLGVQPGTLFRDLVSGKSVRAKDGVTWVHPHQVIQGARPGRVFVVVDCPSVEHISGLVNAKEFQKYQDNDSPTSTTVPKIDCIVHLASHVVFSHPQYQQWTQGFGSTTQHIVVHADYCGQAIVWRGQTEGCYKLSKLNDQIFPVPYYDNKPTFDLPLGGQNIIAAEPLLKFMLEPWTGLDRSEVLPPVEILNDNHESLVQNELLYLRDYCLSATLVSVPGYGGILLDVGEGTYAQMFRHFGKDGVLDRIKSLKAIFISHLHADHHLGIVSVIDQWSKLHDELYDRLYLIAPTRFHNFLRELAFAQPFGYDRVVFINSEDLLYPAVASPSSFSCEDCNDPNPLSDLDPVSPPSTPSRSQQCLEDLLKVSGMSDICTAAVVHCPDAYGISITHHDGWKIVYSGDTRPTDSLTKASQKTSARVSVLLHEATFENDMSEDAIKKGHSTTREAIEMGEQMSARSTLLTHFSQRYPKIPQLGIEDGETTTTEVGICFDLMSVRLDQIWTLARYVPALEVLYSAQSEAAEEEEDEDASSSNADL